MFVIKKILVYIYECHWEGSTISKTDTYFLPKLVKILFMLVQLSSSRKNIERLLSIIYFCMNNANIFSEYCDAFEITQPLA